jgi:hypothetical protein
MRVVVLCPNFSGVALICCSASNKRETHQPTTMATGNAGQRTGDEDSTELRGSVPNIDDVSVAAG